MYAQLGNIQIIIEFVLMNAFVDLLTFDWIPAAVIRNKISQFFFLPCFFLKATSQHYKGYKRYGRKSW